MRKWTEEEIEILIKNKDLPLKELATLIARTPDVIKSKRRKLGYKSRPTPKSWTDEELNVLRLYGANTYTSDLIKRFFPYRTKDSVMWMLKSLKIKKPKEFFDEHMKIITTKKNVNLAFGYELDQNFTLDDLDNATYQILIGSILGDGCVSKPVASQSYIFKESHSIAQSEYLEWKCKMLQKFKAKFNIDAKRNVPFLRTLSHPIFRKIRNDFYLGGNRKTFIPTEYSKKLNEIGLLIWHLDDGYRNIKTGAFLITSSLFDKQTLSNTVSEINNKLNLTLYIRNEKIPLDGGRPVSRIYFTKENVKKITPIWLDLFEKYEIPECMLYKIKKPLVN